MKRRKGKERGLYKARKLDYNGRALISCGHVIREIEGEKYVLLNSGSLLLDDWRDVYEWYLGGKAPGDWIERFNVTAPDSFRELDRLQECNSQLV